MCTDYTNLNKACPKDAYPFPNIDRLVDGAAGHKLLTFLDAYSGYNQIRMHPQDEVKTTFITESTNYCYRVMPFDLKNAGATYQRLMDKIFKFQIDKNLEVYVDDMVVKSNDLSTHKDDLAEVFQQLRKHNMMLNPEKCIFDIAGGKFLGFMLSARSIEANLDKCQTVIGMRSPHNIKEVQKLAVG
uniref:Transposon Ty3-G Gag-Pol polyprotein n=1 Tax=Cajanus cajan TaxID=3821 RepID=A0A151SVN3_CAJCA|nr:Transposon Ty3-G Gag-Pol polyprotein [Cajanus cajan]